MKRFVILLLATLALALALASPAAASFGFKDLDVTFTNEDGSTTTQAGSHPYAFTTSFSVNTTLDGEGREVPDGETEDLTLGQIPGLAGDPNSTPLCPAAKFIERIFGVPQCPDATAVGIVAVLAGFTPPPPGKTELPLHLPVYNLEPPPGVAAKFGFVVLGEPVTVEVGVNQEPPFNIVAHLTKIPQILLFYASEFTIWGNPADEAHDPLRGKCLDYQLSSEEPVSKGLCPVDIPEKPFLTLPRACEGPLATKLQATAWNNGGSSKDEALTHDDSIPPEPQGMTGCGKLGFNPNLVSQPTTTSAESPSGLDLSLNVKDEGLGNPKGLAGSDIRNFTLTLPQGMTVNPSSAEGLGVCTPAQYDAISLTASGCPASSKLGTVSVKTPLLVDPLEGSLYLAQQDDPATTSHEAENPFDSLLALYVVIKSPQYGILVKQASRVEPDPKTGQLISVTEDLPQVPLSEVKLHFREGPRSPLVTPPTCGTYAAKAVFTPWAGGSPVTSTSEFKVTSGVAGGPCPPGGIPPFKPGFQAGSVNNNAASFSPFYMRLTRQDGEQDMTRFDSILPPGVTGKIAGVARCSDAAIGAAKAKTGRQEQASPSCPASSQIGRTLAGAGVGEALTYVPGSLYLSGPYNGAPLSVAAIVPAVAGPFDAGTVVVREALTLNPNTAEVEVDGAASDPIPHILKGIPLKLRDLRVYVDRQNFILNPTSCDPAQARATLFGGYADVFSAADDVPVALASRYQAANCSRLGFKPKLSLQLKGGTKRGQFPALKAVLTPRPGDANIGKAVVTLPHSAFLEQGHIRTICTRVQFAADQCPKGSIYGKATAWTPLLDEPLKGPVYLRSSSNPLPDMVIALHGTVDFDLVGRIDSTNAQIRSSFESPPDAPVSKFVLEMQGAKKGLIVNSTNLCAGKPKRAKAELVGQNGKEYVARPVVKSSCEKAKRKTGKRAKNDRKAVGR
jgi:hypothetical protein